MRLGIRLAAMRFRWPPEPGLARREAGRELQKHNQEEGGTRGKHGFTRISEPAAQPPRTAAAAANGRSRRERQSGEGGIRTLEAGMYPT